MSSQRADGEHNAAPTLSAPPAETGIVDNAQGHF